MTQALSMTRNRLRHRYRRLTKRFGTPAADSPLGSLHFLLNEYEEPEPFLKPEPYKSRTGPHPVTNKTFYLRNGDYSHRLPVHLTYPKQATSALPTILLSPGLGAHSNANRYLELHLASHGYLVIRPRHQGSDLWAAARKTPLGAFTPAELQRRVFELESCLEALFEGRFGLEPVSGQLAFAGHSFGALTSCVLAGLPAPNVTVQSSYPVKAIVALSPYGKSFPTQRLGIDLAGFQTLEVPTVFMSGARDDLFTLGKGPGAHLEPYLASGAEQKLHVIIGDTRHGNFSEVFGWVKARTKTMVNSTVLAFLDRQLRSCSQAEAYLAKELSLVAFEHESWLL